ncbi:MAG: serine hydrolase [Ignavibacteriales bacterium]
MTRRLVTGIALAVIAVLVAGGAARPAGSNGAPATGSPGYEALKSQIEAALAGDPASYSIYFLDLESGREFGINPDLPIPQASTVKVPLVLYVNRLVAQGKANWTDRIAYQPETDYRSGAGALQTFASPGGTYSLRALCNLAITLSDNVAKAMLVRHFGATDFERFMASLGAQQPHVDGQDPTTARDMAIYLQEVLRLAREEPELGSRMIDDLSNTIWHVGLPGRLPAGIQVAHKEGDITGVSNDVGIVFARRPYILCVLSRGQSDTEAGFGKIAAISKMVYDYQEQANRGNLQ